MSRHDDFARLHHMLVAAQEAVGFVKGKGRGDLDADHKLALALVRLLEVIGEAANKVSEEMCKVYTEVPWLQVVGMRNRLIHAYFEVDHDEIWRTVQEDLPLLMDPLKRILESED